MIDSNANEIADKLHNLMEDRILLLDGSMGALILSSKPTEEDFRGERFKNHDVDLKNATDILCLTQPEMILDIHRKYYEAGSDIVETNSFGANILGMKEFGLAELTHEVNVASVKLAKQAAEEYTRKTPDKPRFVAGS